MSGKTALVTGAASGIGKATAAALASLEYLVFAGVLNVAEMQAVEAAGHERLIPIQLDISDAGSIDAAMAAIVGALTAPKAKARYRVGVDSKAAAVLRHLRRWRQGFHSAEDFLDCEPIAGRTKPCLTQRPIF